VKAELEELEREGWEALSGPGAAPFYSELMADDGLMVFPDIVMDKGESLRAIADAAPWVSFDLSKLKVIEATNNSGVVVYHATAQRAGEPPYEADMASHYARRDGRWRLVLHQQSPTRS